LQAFSVRVLLYILLGIGLISCDGYQRVIKKGTTEEKAAAAKKYYQNKQYDKAQPLLEELLGLYYGRDEKEEIYFYYCYTHFALGEFLLAGYHFNNFATTYARSPKREEASYMAALCDYEKAMPPELDQAPTESAITSLQAFINKFPNSEYVDDCNQRIDELRQRLLKKVYKNAKLYYNLGYYRSAIVACNNALDDYPDMINRDELTFLIADAHYQYALNSIAAKQKERYTDALEAFKGYKKEFPNGDFIKNIERLEALTRRELKNIIF
jgi:outer membrane protein assembly factor BamD